MDLQYEAKLGVEEFSLLQVDAKKHSNCRLGCCFAESRVDVSHLQHVATP